METVITSTSRQIKIGPNYPFVIIGERINPSGRKSLAVEMAAGNFERVRADALAQVAAGAQMLDVNAGIPLADEPAILAEAIRVTKLFGAARLRSTGLGRGLSEFDPYEHRRHSWRAGVRQWPQLPAGFRPLDRKIPG